MNIVGAITGFRCLQNTQQIILACLIILNRHIAFGVCKLLNCDFCHIILLEKK